MRRLTWDQVRARRLARSHLARRAPRRKLVEVVREVGGLQAQLLGAAEIGLGIRVAGVTQREIREELWERRTLVKTWTVRGTLHLVPADELTLWTAARRAVGDPWFASWGLDAKQADALLGALRDALDGRVLERQELADEVGTRLGARIRARLTSMWGELVGIGVYGDVVCFGPNRGSKVTFVRADQWVEGHRPADPDASLLDVCRRYVTAYGPVRPRDFAEWFKHDLERGRADELFERLELEEVDVEGHRAWLPAGDRMPRGEAARVRLVPQYDAYVMGFRERERFVPAAAKPHMGFEGVAGSSWLLLDGAVAGIWTRKRQGSRLRIEVEPFLRVPHRDIEAEAARVAEIVGAELELTVRT